MAAIATLLTVLGIAPLVFFAFGAMGPIPETAERMLAALIDYAALLLAFAGGVHWGLALWPESTRPTLRFLGGVLLMAIGWVGLILAQLVASSVALAVLIAGFLATVLTERRAARRSLVPLRYVWLRWGFSGVAVAMMAFVLILRWVGQTIVL